MILCRVKAEGGRQVIKTHYHHHLPALSLHSLPRQSLRNGGCRAARRRGTQARAARPPKTLQAHEERFVRDDLEQLGALLAPWRHLTSPVVFGKDHLPSPPLPGDENKQAVLFVGNHSRFGFYDTPLFLHELYLHGFSPRSLALPSHWLTPLGPVFQHFGAVPATPQNAYRLFNSGEHILLYPGGVREVLKHKGEEYSLQWGDTAPFARLAAKFGAVVVPFAIVGADDAYNIAVDTKEILESPAGPFLRDLIENVSVEGKKLRVEETLQPLTWIPGIPMPSPVPIPAAINRLYIEFLEPIDLRQQPVDHRDPAACAALTGDVKGRVEQGIRRLLDVRSQDPLADLLAREAHALLQQLPTAPHWLNR